MKPYSSNNITEKAWFLTKQFLFHELSVRFQISKEIVFVYVEMKLFYAMQCFCMVIIKFEPRHEKTCFRLYANNKDTDQPVHPRSLISIFVVQCLEEMSFQV